MITHVVAALPFLYHVSTPTLGFSALPGDLCALPSTSQGWLQGEAGPALREAVAQVATGQKNLLLVAAAPGVCTQGSHGPGPMGAPSVWQGITRLRFGLASL